MEERLPPTIVRLECRLFGVSTICVVALASLLAAVFSCLVPSPLLAEAPARVAAILPLTGPTASVGRDLKNGIEFALASLPDAQRAQLQVLFEDEKGYNSAAVSSFHKLVIAPGIDAALCFGSAVGNTLAPLAESERVPLMALCASDVHIVRNRSFAFTHWVAPEKEAELIASEIARRAYHYVATAASEQDGILAIREAAFAALAKRGLAARIVLSDTFAPGTRDFRPFLTRARQKSADAFFLLLFPEDLGLFARQTREAGFSAPLFSAELFEDTSAQETAQGTLSGQWYVSAADLPEEFSRRFEARFGYRPPSWAGNAYDAVTMLAEGLRAGKRQAALAAHLRRLDNFHGSLGVYSATGDGRFDLPAAVKVVK